QENSGAREDSGARGGSGGDASGRGPGSSGATMDGGSGAQSTTGTSSGGGPVEGGTATDDNGSDSGGSNTDESGGNDSGGNDSGAPWCPEFDTCKRGADQRLAPGEECPPGRDCYVDAWCGRDVHCVKFVDDECTDRPTCDPGQLSSPACTGVGVCETRSLCGHAIVCETPLVGACQSKDRVFAATLTEECSARSLRCPEGSSSCSDECGCGCEQPADCPEGVNCQPGSEGQSPLCQSTDCPFTKRAF